MPSILSADSSTQLKLVKPIMSVSHRKTDFFSEYSDYFGELGLLPGKGHIRVNADISPVIHSARRIPLALRDKVDIEHDKMLKLGIIVPVNEPTEWVDQLVDTEKPNWKLRICLDPRDLNEAILRERYEMPTVEQLFSEMSGAKFFTKLDCSNGYWQTAVDEESSKLLMLFCYKGCFRFTRLPYVIHSTRKGFQRRIYDVIKHIPKVKNNQDDIIAWGESIADLENTTKEVLEAVYKNGLKLNKSNCIFNATSIKCLVHIVTTDGIYSDPEKVKAIFDIPIPANEGEVQTFLGMVAYLGKFIPHLSDASAPLRSLIVKNSIWDFTESHKLAFQNIKKLITERPTLKIFDPKLPTKITCDASSRGLEATLEKCIDNMWYPIAFAPRTLGKGERNYCQLEKETSIVFACKKFHYYIYRQQFLIENDHKLLLSIFKKSIYKVPPRLQKIILYYKDMILRYSLFQENKS